MKLVLLLLILSTLLLACDRREAGLRQKITGSWTHTNGYAVITLASNGRFSTRFTVQTQVTDYQGTWQLKNDSLIFTQTTSNSVPQSSVARCRIIQAEGSDLVYESDGQIVSFNRK